MDLSQWSRVHPFLWHHQPRQAGGGLVAAHADQRTLAAMDERVGEEASALADLSGVVTPVHLLPDAHPGFGIPHGSVVGFAPAEAKLLLNGTGAFDHAFGLRALISPLHQGDVAPVLAQLEAALQAVLVAPPGCEPSDAMFVAGAHWAVEQGWGYLEDLAVCEDQGLIAGCDPDTIQSDIQRRWLEALRRPGLGNHQLEIHAVDHLLDQDSAMAFGLDLGQLLVLIHAGSAGLGPRLAGASLPPGGQLSWLPLGSEAGQRALQCQRIALNAAAAFRQVLTHQVRKQFSRFWPEGDLTVLCDFPHNSFRREAHWLGHDSVELWVPRCGSVRAFGPSHGEHPEAFHNLGTPVILAGAFGGTTELVCGVDSAEQLALSSTICGMGTAEVAEHAGLCRRVARLRPLLSIQG